MKPAIKLPWPENRRATPESIRIRFESFIERIPFSGCWLWTGTLAGPKRDYATFSINHKNVRAHRVSWEIFKGPIPQGLMVLHRCDVRSCVNPDHLFVGTAQDNADDMIAKGRDFKATGIAAGMTKLTAEQVQVIREEATSGKSRSSIAKEYGVATATIRAVVLRITWKHV